MTQSNDAEFDAMKTIHDALSPLDESARSRVVQYIVNRLEIDAPTHNFDTDEQNDTQDNNVSTTTVRQTASIETFAELYDLANPTTTAEKALVSGYWLQACEGAENFASQAANKELTHLGHKIANITKALDSLKSTKPALILQLKKSGGSQQARKTYKLSHAGLKKVEEMISGAAE